MSIARASATKITKLFDRVSLSLLIVSGPSSLRTSSSPGLSSARFLTALAVVAVRNEVAFESLKILRSGLVARAAG